MFVSIHTNLIEVANKHKMFFYILSCLQSSVGLKKVDETKSNIKKTAKLVGQWWVQQRFQSTFILCFCTFFITTLVQHSSNTNISGVSSTSWSWSGAQVGDAGGVWGGSGWHIKYVSPTKGYGMRQLPVHFLLSALIWVIVLWLSFSDSCDKDLNELSQSLREPSW